MYGGTKTEMEHLLADAQALTGVEYNIDNLGDVYDAIHAIQGDLGLTGVAAAEASQTFSGSFEAMKAAAANLLGNLALGENIDSSMQSLTKAVMTFVGGNLLPMIGTVLKSLPTAIGTAISTGAPIVLEAGQELVTNIITGISENLPMVLENGEDIVTDLIEGIQTALPELIEEGGTVLTDLANTFTEYFPLVMDKGMELLRNLMSGIGAAIPELANYASQAITSFANFIANNLPMIGSKGGELIGTLASGIIKNMPAIIRAVGQVASAILKGIVKLIPQLGKAAVNMAKGIATGLGGSALEAIKKAIDNIKNALTKPIDAAKNTISGIISKIKGMFPIHIGNILSGIKTPHFSINWTTKDILGKSYRFPSGVGVSWYAKGGIFDDASLIGVGEAGREAVIPLSGRYMRPFAKAIGEEMSGLGTNNTFIFNVDGAENPEEWASRTMRQLKMEVRMA